MEFKEALALRQSTRNYRTNPVAADALENIVHAGVTAPISLSRYESYHLTVITAEGVLKKLEEEWLERGNTGNPIYDAPALIVVFGDEKVTSGLRNADTGCIVTQMHLAATALGLGSCYICGAIQQLGKDARYLNGARVPANFVPMGALAVGEPMRPLKARHKESKMTVDRL